MKHSKFLQIALASLVLSFNAQAEEAKKENTLLNISVASTPSEFRCEALHIADFDKVNESMASLKESIHKTFGLNDSCVTTTLAKPENQKHLNQLLENIQGGVSTVRGQLANQYVESLAQVATGVITSDQAYEITAGNQKKAKAAVELVVGSMKELNALIEKNPLNISSAKNCKTHYSSSERFIFGVAEMVEDVSPLLIQAVTRIPGLQELAPAVIGASMISSAITHYAEVAQKRVDINKPENRSAILINTCQLVKTYDKMRFLRGLKNNPAEEKQKISQMISTQSSLIKNELMKPEARGNDNQWIAAVDQQNQNFLTLNDHRAVMTEGDLVQICEKRDTVLTLSEGITNVHTTIARISGNEPALQDEMFLENIAKYTEASKSKALGVEDCARNTQTLFTYLDAFNRRTFQILMDFKKARLTKNKSFYQASYSLTFLRSFQSILDQMDTDNVFEKLQTSIARTEALINQSKVLKAWFGNAKNFYLPGIDTYRNPVMDLMNYHERQVLMFREPLADEAADFDMNMYEMYKFWHPKDPKMSEEAYFKKFDVVRHDLSILNPVYLDSKSIATPSGRSSPHERACSGMLAMRDNFRSMIEAFNTMKYFCQMLRPLLNEPEVSDALKRRCLGVNDLVPNSPRTRLSGVDQLLEPVSVDVKRMPIIERKIKELKCET